MRNAAKPNSKPKAKWGWLGVESAYRPDSGGGFGTLLFGWVFALGFICLAAYILLTHALILDVSCTRSADRCTVDVQHYFWSDSHSFPRANIYSLSISNSGRNHHFALKPRDARAMVVYIYVSDAEDQNTAWAAFLSGEIASTAFHYGGRLGATLVALLLFVLGFALTVAVWDATKKAFTE